MSLLGRDPRDVDQPFVGWQVAGDTRVPIRGDSIARDVLLVRLDQFDFSFVGSRWDTPADNYRELLYSAVVMLRYRNVHAGWLFKLHRDHPLRHYYAVPAYHWTQYMRGRLQAIESRLIRVRTRLKEGNPGAHRQALDSPFAWRLSTAPPGWSITDIERARVYRNMLGGGGIRATRKLSEGGVTLCTQRINQMHDDHPAMTIRHIDFQRVSERRDIDHYAAIERADIDIHEWRHNGSQSEEE